MFEKKYLLLIIGGLIALLSCKDNVAVDNDLKAINEVHFENIKKDYYVMQGEKLQIEPALTFTKDADSSKESYKYEWLLFEGGPFADFDTLATTRNLNVIINQKPYDYKAYYLVEDLKTGIQWRTAFKLHVRSSIYEGWMVLSGVKGTARLDMISLIDGQYTPIYDVLGYINSRLQLEGAPVDISCFFTNTSQPYSVFVTAEGTGTTKIQPETFGWSPKLLIKNFFFSDVPDHFAADFILKNYFYKDGNVYRYTYAYGGYSLPINNIDGTTETYNAAPFIAINAKGNDVLYDETQGRFVQGGASEMPQGTLFDYNATGMDLVFMTGSEYNGGEIFAILKDPETSTYHLARIDGSTYTQLYWDKMTAPDIDKASYFAVSPVYGYIFYSVNGKVYQYDMGTKTTKLMLNKGAQEITWMGFIKGDLFTPFKYRDNLIIASNDPSLPADSSGIFEIYSVPSVNGQIVLKEKYTGFGKIKDIDYRERF